MTINGGSGLSTNQWVFIVVGALLVVLGALAAAGRFNNVRWLKFYMNIGHPTAEEHARGQRPGGFIAMIAGSALIIRALVG